MKLNAQHIGFIVSKFAVFQHNRLEMVRMLSDQAISAEYDFPPIKITRQALDYHIAKEEVQIAIKRKQYEYLDDYTEIELAHRKSRIKELVKMYDSIDAMKTADGKAMVPKTKFDMKLSVLRQLKEEKGEDVQTMAEALEKSSNINLTVGETILGYFPKPNDQTRTDSTQEEIH